MLLYHRNNSFNAKPTCGGHTLYARSARNHIPEDNVLLLPGDYVYFNNKLFFSRKRSVTRTVMSRYTYTRPAVFSDQCRRLESVKKEKRSYTIAVAYRQSKIVVTTMFLCSGTNSVLIIIESV